MLYQSVCQPSDPSFIWMETGEVEFCPLQCELFCYCTSVCSPRHPLWPVLHFAFFITNLGELAGPMLSGFTAFPFFTLSLSLFVTFLSLTVFTQPLRFLTPALFSLFFPFCIYFYPLSNFYLYLSLPILPRGRGISFFSHF